MKRHKMNYKASKKDFTRKASRTETRNTYLSPMRGGYRL